MKIHRCFSALALLLLIGPASAGTCRYFDSKVAEASALTVGGTGASVLAGASAMELAGITAVAHSSTAMILTGSTGYIGSTLGLLGTAGSIVAATPVVIGAGVLTGVVVLGAGSVAVFCHPPAVFGRVGTYYSKQKENVSALLRR